MVKLSTTQEKALLAIATGVIRVHGLVGFRTSSIRSLAREALVTYPKLPGGHFDYQAASLTPDGRACVLLLNARKKAAHAHR